MLVCSKMINLEFFLSFLFHFLPSLVANLFGQCALLLFFIYITVCHEFSVSVKVSKFSSRLCISVKALR